MNPQLNQAIIAFIENEFMMESKMLDPDFDFSEELGLNQDELIEFLQRMQEALSINIPEDRIADIKTLDDLYSALNSDDALD